jgi:hypothetical protein
VTQLERSALLGYGPAQAALAACMDKEPDSAFELAQRSAVQRSRFGLYTLGIFLLRGVGCEKDELKAVELFKQAPELGHCESQKLCGVIVFREHKLKRCVWLGRAAVGGLKEQTFRIAVVCLLPSFRKSEHGQVLHYAASLMAKFIDFTEEDEALVFGEPATLAELRGVKEVLNLCNAMMERATEAILCWGIVGRRRGLVRDIRGNNKAWEEAWRWGTKEKKRATKKTRRR